MRMIAMLSTSAIALGFANTPAAERVAPVTTAAFTVALPERETAKRGSTSLYPFDTLTEIGQSFGVKNKDVRGMSSIISNQNKKHKTEVRNADGNIEYHTKTLTGPDGTATEVADTSKPKMTFSKKFEAREVTPDIAKMLKGTPGEGSKVIVTRVA